MNQSSEKIKKIKPVIFLNIFPKPEIKQELCTKEESFPHAN